MPAGGACGKKILPAHGGRRGGRGETAAGRDPVLEGRDAGRGGSGRRKRIKEWNRERYGRWTRRICHRTGRYNKEIPIRRNTGRDCPYSRTSRRKEESLRAGRNVRHSRRENGCFCSW